MKRLAAIVAMVLVLPISSASAQAEAETFRERFSDSFVDRGCEGRVRVHVEGRFVAHVTERPDGSVNVHITVTGTFQFTESGETFRGHFREHFSFHQWENKQSSTGTFSANGKGDEGTHISFRAVSIFNTNANGEVTVEFEKVRLICR